MRAVALGRIIVQFILAALFAAGVASAAREGAGRALDPARKQIV